MKVTYDASLDIVRILFSDAPIAESNEDKPEVIVDYAENGRVVGIEIMDASKNMNNPGGVEYAIVGMKPA